MTVLGSEPIVYLWHCTGCQVDWSTKLGRDCWACGRPGQPGHLPGDPWPPAPTGLMPEIAR